MHRKESLVLRLDETSLSRGQGLSRELDEPLMESLMESSGPQRNGTSSSSSTRFSSLEFKSQVGSFGNNYNNRTEEALGNATDLWAAYREGAFKLSPKPWLGYLMLLEEAPRSTAAVSVAVPHFKVFDEFKDASYAKRYEILCQKLVRERLYDAACFILSDPAGGARGAFKEPNPELSFQNFVTSLMGHSIAYAKNRDQKR